MNKGIAHHDNSGQQFLKGNTRIGNRICEAASSTYRLRLFPENLPARLDTNALSEIKVGVVFPTPLVTSRISLFIVPPKFRYNIAGAHEYIYLNNGFSPHRSSVSECKAIALITRIRRIGIGNSVLLLCACAD